MGKKYSAIGDKEYAQIKALTGAGFKNQMIMELTGRSIGTICYINKSTDLEDYKKILSEVKARNKKVVATEEPDPAPVVVEVGIAAQLARLNSNIEKMLDDYKWVMEHAEIKTKRRWL